jgi:hypothetical protein
VVYFLSKYVPKRIAIYGLPGVLNYENSMCVEINGMSSEGLIVFAENIIKDFKQANNFILGYLIFFISSIFIPYYFSVFSVMLASIFNELYDFWKSDKEDYKFDLINIGYTFGGMIPSLLLQIIG